VTEIPEHLLKRAKERRAAMEGGAASDDAPAEAPAAGGDAPAPAAAASAPAKKAPAPLPTLDPEPAKVVPDIPVVAAARNRKRVPYWAASVLALLPLWGMIYYYSVQPPPAGENDPLVIGKDVYTTAGCSGCHGASGEGGVGQKLKDGHVLETFADPLSMAHWIRFGAAEGARPNGSYGDPDAKRSVNDLPSSAMPAFDEGTIPDEKLAALIIYVREELSEGEPADDPKFNVDSYAEDPTGIAAWIAEVTELGPGGDPDVASIEGAEEG
jgi:mono/diheme cytochrome c family protein